MDKFQNKYRIPSARAPFWDYGWNASYFVTICTHNHICYFGDIVEGEMILSDIGEIALSYIVVNRFIKVFLHYMYVFIIIRIRKLRYGL